MQIELRGATTGLDVGFAIANAADVVMSHDHFAPPNTRSLFLKMLQIKDQTEHPACCLRSRASVIVAGLHPKTIAPDRHLARTVATNYFTSIDGAVNLPKRKRAAILLRKLREIRRSQNQEF